MNDGAILRILRCFIETNVLSFSELCSKAGYPTDLGGYYIRHLVSAKYLVKTARGRYEITPRGKQRFLSLERQQSSAVFGHARFCVMVMVKQGDKFVIIRRKRQPYVGFAEWPAMVLLPGEGVIEGAQRLLNTRLSVTGRPTLLGFFRRIDLYENIVFDDKLFAVHVCELEANHTIASISAYGNNLLVSADELLAIDKPAQSLHDIYAFSQAPTEYVERRYMLSLQDIIPAN